MSYLQEAFIASMSITEAQLAHIRECVRVVASAGWMWGATEDCPAGWAFHSTSKTSPHQTVVVYCFEGEGVEIFQGRFTEFEEAHPTLPGLPAYFRDPHGVIYTVSQRGGHTNYPGPLRTRIDFEEGIYEVDLLDPQGGVTSTHTLWASLHDLADLVEQFH